MIRRKNNIGICISLVILIVILVGIGIVFSWGGTNEINTADNAISVDTYALVCDSGANDMAFFNNTDAIDEHNKIKVLFVDGQAARIFYSYTGNYDAESTAEYHEAVLHSDYNKYLSGKGLSGDLLSETFSSAGKTVKIEIYSEVDKNAPGLGEFFFIPDEDVSVFSDLSDNEIKKYYEGKGFSCIINN